MHLCRLRTKEYTWVSPTSFRSIRPLSRRVRDLAGSATQGAPCEYYSSEVQTRTDRSSIGTVSRQALHRLGQPWLVFAGHPSWCFRRMLATGATWCRDTLSSRGENQARIGTAVASSLQSKDFPAISRSTPRMTPYESIMVAAMAHFSDLVAALWG